jgi:hypothetical protein
MDMQKKATWYARKGLAVFPLATIEDGQCSCGRYDCGSPGKHPLGSIAPHGCLDATTDAQTIDQWFALYPDANIGIATGQRSGIVVIDVDEDHGGWDTIENLIDRNGELPETWVAQTGGGGGHFYFQAPPIDIRNSAGLLGPGIDIRGQGGYVVAPPSTHLSGTRYRWVDGNHPLGTELAPLPEWLYLRIAKSERMNGLRQASPLPLRLTAGIRNTWLASIAGTMRHRGCSADAINAALQVENTNRCEPPLGVREVERIAVSIERYPPAAQLTVNGHGHSLYAEVSHS